jgi:hypothetical protein
MNHPYRSLNLAKCHLEQTVLIFSFHIIMVHGRVDGYLGSKVSVLDAKLVASIHIDECRLLSLALYYQQVAE